MQREDLIRCIKNAEKTVRIVLIFLSTVLLPNLFIAVALMDKEQELEFGSTIFFYAAGILFLVFYYSMVKIYGETNRQLSESYKAQPSSKATGNHNKKSKTSFIAKRRIFWVESLVFVILYFVFTPQWIKDFHKEVLADSFIKSFAVFKVAFVVLVFIIFFLSQLSVLAEFDRSSHYKVRQRNRSQEIKEWSFYIKWGINFLIFGIIFGLAVILVPISKDLINAFSVIPFFAIAGYIILFLAIKRLYQLMVALNTRRTFLRSFKELCVKEGYEIKDQAINNPYFSILKPFIRESFVVTAHGDSYSCKLLGFSKKNNPLYFLDNKKVNYVKVFNLLKAELFRYSESFSFDYDSPHKKIIILNPTPKFVYLSSDGKNTEIENGDRIGEYIIFTGTGFLNALGRNSIIIKPKDYIKY